MVNKIILIGNVGKDPEVRYLQNGTAVAQFSLATSETYKDKDGNKQTSTEWHNIVLWRGLAEIAEKYIKKGSKLYIEGKITYRSYDAQDGTKRYVTEVVGNNMQMLDSRSSGASTPPPSPEAASNSNTTSAEQDENLPADDLPF
jgi:single-strand DNA-binding protein